MENINQVVEKLTPVFQSVAEKIGEGAEFGWSIVYRQQIAYGIKDAIMCFLELVILIIFLVITVKITKYSIKKNKEEEEKGNYTGEYLSFMFIPIGITIIYFIVFCIDFFARLGSAILHLTNPSYYALEFFINLVK